MKNCHFSFESTDYLGHLTAPERLEVARTTAKAVQTLQSPEDVFQMRLFPNLNNHYRHFVREFAKIAALSKKKAH